MKWFLRLVLAGSLRFCLYEVLSITWGVDCVGGEVAQMEKTHKKAIYHLLGFRRTPFICDQDTSWDFVSYLTIPSDSESLTIRALSILKHFKWNVLDRAMHLYNLYLPHKCFELCWWRSWHQNGWSKKGWVGEMAGNVCVSNAQNLATGKWGESSQCAVAKWNPCYWMTSSCLGNSTCWSICFRYLHINVGLQLHFN